MDYKNLYEILGIGKRATDKEISSAYKILTKKWHPDKHIANKTEAEKRMCEINEAYSILSDKEKRKNYDEGVVYKHINVTGEDIVNEFFGF
jgi:DnaJ-class molecular chaperone